MYRHHHERFYDQCVLVDHLSNGKGILSVGGSSNLLDCASPLLECGSTRLLFFRGYAVAVSLGPEI